MVGIWVEIGDRDNGATLSHPLGLVKLAIRLALPFTGIYPRSKLIPFRAQSPEKVLESHSQAQLPLCFQNALLLPRQTTNAEQEFLIVLTRLGWCF